MIVRERKNKIGNTKWILEEVIDPRLTEEDIKKIVNKKLAKIIIELEHNPVSFINYEKLTNLNYKEN